MDPPINIYGLAARLGISYGTVSRALNGRAGVAPQTRARVLAAARELGFVPSPLARGLARSVTSAIGIVIPTMADPFFLEFTRSAQETAEQAGVAMMMSFADGHDQTLMQAVRSFAQFRVAGVLLLGGNADQDHAIAGAMARTPVIVALRRSADGLLPAVYVDHEAGARDMVAYLVATGRRRIAYVSLPPSTQAAHERLKGYREGMAAHGLAGAICDVVAPGNGFKDGATGTDGLFSRHPGETFDAIFYASDALATGGLHALARRGLTVPGEIAVAGFGDISSSEVTQPALTTMHIPLRDMGERAVRLLLGRIDDPQAGDSLVELPLRLIRRAST